MTVNTKNLYRGDDKTYLVTIRNTSGVVVDITSGVIEFTLKANPNDPNPLIHKSSAVSGEAAITNPTGGQAEIYLIPSDTRNLKAGTYVYDVQYTDSAGKIATVIKDDIYLLDDVTRA